MGTKLVNGIMIHACLKEIAIPLSDNNGAGIAEYLTAVISLVTAQQDNMTFLAKPATSKICYREDSPVSKGSNITYRGINYISRSISRNNAKFNSFFLSFDRSDSVINAINK
ncbi:hypothetical protein EDC96DRAFT_539902 [Choanephora cucurbitarum]|nr:hypothetical protein EDC96DRAFT_539902 [Choanephora cucurbitarum]